MSIIHGQAIDTKKAKALLCDADGRLLTTAGGTTENEAQFDTTATESLNFDEFPPNIGEIGLLKTLVLLQAERYEVTREAGAANLGSSTPINTAIPVLAPVDGMSIVGLSGTVRGIFPSGAQDILFLVLCGSQVIWGQRIQNTNVSNFNLPYPIKNGFQCLIDTALTGSNQISFNLHRFSRKGTMTDLDGI